MSYRLVVRPQVEADLIEAETWYEQQQAGLGHQFLLAAREAMESLSRQSSYSPSSLSSQAGALGIHAPVSLPHNLPSNSRHGGYICRRPWCAPRPPVETTPMRGSNMIDLHPEIIEKDGKKQFVILQYEEFVAVEQALADAEDLAALRAAKKEEHAAPGVPLEQASTRHSVLSTQYSGKQ